MDWGRVFKIIWFLFIVFVVVMVYLTMMRVPHINEEELNKSEKVYQELFKE